MKRVIPLILSAVLVTNTLGCSQTKNQDSQTTTDSKTQVADKASNQEAIAPAGTNLEAILQENISTGKNKDSDRFVLKLKNSSIGKNQALKDAQINGHLENVVKAAKGKKAKLNLVFDDITLKDGSAYPINATLVNTQVETKTKGKFIQNAGIILGGAVAGRFLGDKAKFKNGTLAGAAAATAYVLSSPGGEVALKKGTKIKIKLNSPLGK
ncbi:hypothetical protein [Calothrix sp. 336/3]|uniref:hypothetical protein n=1 Tax=Calothrix sp. 336/3 TaxID=1337936 RepID=UPI0004E3D42B|nr:hypothetical protein [Calothrix sp. 336/3]AKG20902.1 hypothetical protein IJ00_05945 [Calothrix sp. 336/3]